MLHIGEDSFVALRYTESGGDGRRRLSLIRDDDLAGRSLDEAGCYQRIELHPVERAFDEWITYKDCNFDGYTDIIASSDAIYLWNPDEKKYGKAQVSGEFLSLPYQVYFPDTETILGYVYDYVDPKPADWNDVDKVESLWQWEGDELVKKRECEAQVRADVVNLQAYDMVFGRKLFEQSVRQEEYSDGSTNVQALFAQFYDKLAPADAFSCFHTINYSKEDMTYIPQGLLDQVEGAMLDGTELENLKPMVNDRELSGEEVAACRVPEGTIAVMATNMDTHNRDNPGGSFIVPTAGPYFGVPYLCLVPKGADNLLVAGRAISADALAGSAVRMMPSCMAFGQAAGVAAAMAAAADIPPRDVDVAALRRKLTDQGAFVGD